MLSSIDSGLVLEYEPENETIQEFIPALKAKRELGTMHFLCHNIDMAEQESEESTSSEQESSTDSDFEADAKECSRVEEQDPKK